MLKKETDHTLIIKKSTALKFINFKEVWEYKDLIYMFLVRDLKGRYKQTALGPLWIIIQPIITTIVYSILLGTMAKFSSENMNYAVFTYTGLIAWGLFSRTVNATVTSLSGEIALMAKVYYPRIISVISHTLSGVVDFLVSFAVMFFILWQTDTMPSINMIYLPLFVLLILFCGISVGLWFAGPNVKYRDITRGIGLGLSLLQYISPVIYSTTEVMKIIPVKFQYLYYLNPFTFFIEGFRWCVVGTSNFSYSHTILYSYGVILILFIGGLYYFKRWERTIVDIQ